MRGASVLAFGVLAFGAAVVAACSGAPESIITEGSSSGSVFTGSSSGSSSSGSGGSTSSSGGHGSSASGSSGGSSGSGSSSGTGSSSSSGSGSGSSGSSSGSGSGSSSSSGGPTCAPTLGDGGACNSLGTPAASVAVACSTDPAPAPTGGVIRDGFYVMTSSTYYSDGAACETPENDGVRWQICGSTWQVAQELDVSGQPPNFLDANLTVVAAGPTLTLTVTCGIANAPPFTFAYDADATTLRLHTQGTGTTGRVDTFTRQ